MAALATGGIVLARGVAGASGTRGPLIEVAGAIVSATDPHLARGAEGSVGVAQRSGEPAFSSSLRSWSASPPSHGSAALAPAQPVEQPAQPDGAAAVAERPETAHPGGAEAVAERPETYTVATGDTLSEIAARYSVDVGALASANHLSNVNVLVPGVQLQIPTGVMNLQHVPAPVPPPASQQPIPPPVQLAAQAPAPEPAKVPPSGAGSTAPTSAFSTASPEDAVRSFYAAVEQHRFDQAAGLWSQHMHSAYPPAQNISSRFAATRAVTVTQANVTKLDLANGRATVAVRLSEVVGVSPSLTRQYVGTWCLVRGSDGGWLLDQPDLQQT